jgi:hypothetical protein
MVKVEMPKNGQNVKVFEEISPDKYMIWYTTTLPAQETGGCDFTLYRANDYKFVQTPCGLELQDLNGHQILSLWGYKLQKNETKFIVTVPTDTSLDYFKHMLRQCFSMTKIINVEEVKEK